MTKMHLYTAACTGNAKNCRYPNEVAVSSEESLRAAVSKDHVCAKYKNSYRSNDNFLLADCIVMDCDNDHSDDSKDHYNHGEVEQYYLKNTHEPIITRENFEKVQHLIGQRKKERKIQDRTGFYQSNHLFTGKMICLHCGAHLKHVVRSGRKSGLYDAWACPTHIRDKDKCPLKVLEDSKIRAAFTTMMNKLIFARRQVLEPYIKNLENLDTENADKEIAEIDAAYSALLKQQAAIMQLAADGVLDTSTCQKELADLNDKKNDLGSKKTSLTLAVSNNYKLKLPIAKMGFAP